MKASRIWLSLAAAAWLVLPAAAAPAPTPPSDGPLSDALALRGLIGKTAPPMASNTMVVEKGVIEVGSLAAVPVAQSVAETVTLPNGKQEQVVRTVTSVQYEPRYVRYKVDAVKFFTVTAEGKLQPLDAAKATETLEKTTPVLTGDSAEVEARNLELVRPGTLYLVLPPPEAPPLPGAAPPPGGGKRE